MLAILVPWYAAILSDFSRQDLFKLFIPTLFFPLWLPYAWVFWSLRSNADAHKVKKGLAVAVGCGSLIFLLCSFLLVQTSFDADPTINTAQVEYARAHPDKGFASSLAELGPESGAALIDSVLASGRKSGYVFVLTAASPDSHGRITHYTVIARPQRYGKEGKHSFLMDESGVQHFTTEDRAPTAQDPALQ